MPDPDPTAGSEFAPIDARTAPEAPAGYQHRWIRTSIRGEDDRTNVASRLREGWEPVRADEYPELADQFPTIDEGKFEGVIGVGGLILCRIPIETVQERAEYFANKTQSQMDAVDNDMMKDGTHPSMSISRPERQSRVTIGGTQGSGN